MEKTIGDFMYKELNSLKHCLLNSFLLYEEKNKNYKYYFDLLPKDYSNFPIFYFFCSSDWDKEKNLIILEPTSRYEILSIRSSFY